MNILLNLVMQHQVSGNNSQRFNNTSQQTIIFVLFNVFLKKHCELPFSSRELLASQFKPKKQICTDDPTEKWYLRLQNC